MPHYPHLARWTEILTDCGHTQHHRSSSATATVLAHTALQGIYYRCLKGLVSVSQKNFPDAMSHSLAIRPERRMRILENRDAVILLM